MVFIPVIQRGVVSEPCDRGSRGVGDVGFAFKYSATPWGNFEFEGLVVVGWLCEWRDMYGV